MDRVPRLGVGVGWRPEIADTVEALPDIDWVEAVSENLCTDHLPVPLAVENVAALINWPDEEMTEGQFLAELVARTGVLLLIDVANLHTNHVNRGEDPARALDELPVEAIAYVHVAGGVERDGVWHDTHAHPVTAPVLAVLAELRARVVPPGVLLERDEDFPPPPAELAGEIDAIRGTVAGTAVPRPSSVVSRQADEWSDDPADGPHTDSARGRLAHAQGALLASLVAGAPVPAGFDHGRLDVQRHALLVKRASVVARIAPDLPEILGPDFRALFLAYAADHPQPAGHRRDALDFAGHLLDAGLPATARQRRRLSLWWRERAGSRPPRRVTRPLRALLAGR